MGTNSEMHKLGHSDRLKRIRELRKLKKASKYENKKELNREYKAKQARAKEIEEKERLEEQGIKSVEKSESIQRGVDYDRLKSLDYTAEEDEAWNKKLEAKKTRDDQREFQNYDQLAERTYNKRLREIEGVSMDEYKQQKEIYAKLRNQGVDEATIITALTDKKKAQNLGRGIRKRDRERYKRREKKVAAEGTDIGFINDKNKQFNEKLGRHFDKYLGELKEDIKRGGAA
ncbi:hypothetical protein BRETT_003520 [Brettanomyces bruxellensis]|uniref:Pre-mRNA-splicing factor SYF2 n=1 Tax=Dekkera bruxellensis TaxID=5007 RepID=A0A871R019_DEKBR|nr:uncharacterized protein BRETT_003520 [Brettanomyces bruxellensis]QOU19373.1 hypothetical protein BRETT_003520 [Brettanomyces bruxellensis]